MDSTYENFMPILFSVIMVFCIFALMIFCLVERIRIILQLKLRIQKKERRKDIIRKFLAIRKTRRKKQKQDEKEKLNFYQLRQNLSKNH